MNQHYNPQGHQFPMTGLSPVPPYLAAGPASWGASLLQGTRPKWIGILLLWLVVTTAVWDANSVGRTLIGTNRIFTTWLFIFCVILLFIFRFAILKAWGVAGNLYILTMFIYLLVGTRFGTSLLSPSNFFQWGGVRTVFAALLLIAVCALGAQHLMLAWPLTRTMRILFIISLLGVSSVFLGMYWEGLYAFRGGIGGIYRQAGFYINPNRTGVICCGAAAIGFATLVQERRKLWVAIGIGLCVFALILTFSRGSMLVFIVLIFGQLVFNRIIRQKSVVIGIAIAIGISIWMAIRVSDQSSDFGEVQRSRVTDIASILQGNVSNETTGGRLRVLKIGLEQCLRRPVIGNGLLFMNIMPGTTLGPHNTYIAMWGDAGFVPVIMLGIFFVYVTFKAWRCSIPAVRLLVLGYILTFAASGMISHGELKQRHHNAMFGICFGLLAGASELERRNKMGQLRDDSQSFRV